MNKWIDKLSYKMRRIAVPSLMKYIVISMGAFFVLDLFFGNLLTQLLVFDKAAIMRGEIWRLISFIFIPINSSPLFIIFTLYFYWMIGEALEREWGVAKFNLFYLTGVAGTLVAGLITGFATNQYLNMSLFLAFAILFPNFELRLFFVLPVKIKWLAYLDLAFFLFALIVSGWPERIALLVSLANIVLFFHDDARRQINNIRRKRQWQNQFK